jgi:hypothetical protein
VEMTGTILRVALDHACVQNQFIEASPAENIPIPRPARWRWRRGQLTK